MVGQKLFCSGSKVSWPLNVVSAPLRVQRVADRLLVELAGALDAGDQDLPGVPGGGRLRLEDGVRQLGGGRPGLEVVDDLRRRRAELVQRGLVGLEDA